LPAVLENQELLQELGVGTKVLGGLAVGLRRDPLIRPVVDKIGEVFNLGPEDFDTLESRIQDSTLADTATIVGEWGPTLLMGAGSYAVGRAAVMGVLPKAASLAAQRAGMLVGGALGTGALGGAQSLARGESLTEAAKQAGLTALFSAGTEGALIGAGKLLAPRARNIFNRTEQIANFKALQTGVTKDVQAGNKVAALRHRLAQLLDTEALEKQLTLFPDESTGATVAGQTELFGAKELKSRILAGKTQSQIRADRIRRLTMRLNKAETLEGASANFGLTDRIIPTEIVRAEPLKFGDSKLGTIRAVYERALARVAQTPEGTAQKLGVTGTRTLQLLAEAEDNTFINSGVNTAAILKWVGDVAESVGKKRPSTLTQADDIITPILQVGEIRGGGLAAIREQFGAKTADLFDEMLTFNRQLYEPVSKMGGELLMTAGELDNMHVAFYWPHVPKDLPEEEFIERMVAGLSKQGVDPISARATADRILRSTHAGLAKWGSVDFQRGIRGTLQEKVAAGIPLDGPITGLLRHADAVTRRIEYGKRFGINGEMRDQIMEIGRREGVDRRMLSSFLDDAFSRKIGDAALRSVAQTITSLETATKMTFGVLGNIGQQSSNAFTYGVKNTLRGSLLGLKRDPVATGLAASIMEDEFQAMRRLHSGIYRDSWADKLAQSSLSVLGFNTIERWNRRGTVTTTDSSIREAIARAITGRLRGTSLDAKTRLLGRVGINLPRVVETAKGMGPGRQDLIIEAVEAVHGAGAYTRALFRGTQLTQFIPTRYQVPPLWDTPWGRVLTQFKRYGLLQGRLIRDQVLAEAAHGNMRPLVTIGSIYPIVGEVLATTLATAKDRERDSDGVMRLVDNVSAMGGFGIAQSAAVAAQFGRLEDVFVGPAASDFFAFGEAALSLNSGAALRQLERTPAIQAAKKIVTLGAGSVDQLSQWMDEATE
jgi:hypothetical protein